MSPTTPSVISTFLFISATSTSNCRIFACSANFFAFPVTRSLNLAPTTISRSHSADPVIGSFRSMHAKHSGVERVCSRERAFSHQGITDRSVHFFHKLVKFFAGVGKDRALLLQRYMGLFRLTDQSQCGLHIFFAEIFGRTDRRDLFFLILCLIGSDILGEYRSAPDPDGLSSQ